MKQPRHPRCRTCRKRRPLTATIAGQLCAQCAPVADAPERVTADQLAALAEHFTPEGHR